MFCEELSQDAVESEAKHTPPTKEMRMRFGERGIPAMVQGPGEHLKIGGGFLGSVVKPEEFDYFHELVVQEERTRSMCPGFEDGLDGVRYEKAYRSSFESFPLWQTKCTKGVVTQRCLVLLLCARTSSLSTREFIIH